MTTVFDEPRYRAALAKEVKDAIARVGGGGESYGLSRMLPLDPATASDVLIDIIGMIMANNDRLDDEGFQAVAQLTAMLILDSARAHRQAIESVEGGIQ
jgi:hypothetical protein